MGIQFEERHSMLSMIRYKIYKENEFDGYKTTSDIFNHLYYVHKDLKISSNGFTLTHEILDFIRSAIPFGELQAYDKCGGRRDTIHILNRKLIRVIGHKKIA